MNVGDLVRCLNTLGSENHTGTRVYSLIGIVLASWERSPCCGECGSAYTIDVEVLHCSGHVIEWNIDELEVISESR